MSTHPQHAASHSRSYLTNARTRHREKSYPCASPQAASIIFKAMEVEKELRENLVSRTMALDGAKITVTFRAVDESSLGSSVNAFDTSFAFAKDIYNELG